MLRRAVDHMMGRVGPQTALGRWCGVWYNEACDAMSKGSLADADNSLWTLPPPKGKSSEGAEPAHAQTSPPGAVDDTTESRRLPPTAPLR